MKKYKIYLIGVLVFLLILIVGFKNLKNNSQKILSSTKEDYQKILKNAPPEFKTLIDLINLNEKEIYRTLKYNAQILSIENSFEKMEMYSQIFSVISPYLQKIQVDNSKTPQEYANEIKPIFNKLRFIQLNFDDKNSLALTGETILSVAKELSDIKVPHDYYNFHVAEIMILASLGEVLKSISFSNDAEKSTILMSLLNDLVEAQEKLINKL